MKFVYRLPIKVRVTAVFVAVGVVWGSAWIPETSLSQTQPEFVVFRDACFIGALRFALAAVVLGGLAVLMQVLRHGDARDGQRGDGPGLEQRSASWPNADYRGAANSDSGVDKAGRRRRWIGKRWFWGSCLAGVTMLGLPYALTAWAAGRVSPGMVALCFGLMPLAIVLGEDEAREGAIPRTALGIGGVAMMVAPGLSFGLQQAAGVSALLAAMGLSGFSAVYLRKLQVEHSGSDVWDAECRRGDFGVGAERLVTSAAIQFGVASVLLAMPALSSGIGPLAPVHLNDVAALPLAVLAIVVSAGTLPLFLWLLRRLPAWQAATLQWMSTLVAVGEGAWSVHVRLAAEGWIGAALVAGCTVSVLRTGAGGAAGEISGISGNVAEEAILDSEPGGYGNSQDNSANIGDGKSIRKRGKLGVDCHL